MMPPNAIPGVSFSADPAKTCQAIDMIPALVWTAGPDGSVDFLNRRWQEYTGLDGVAAQGWEWQQAIHPDDLEGLMSYWHSLLGSGEPGMVEARLRKFDGSYRWFSFYAIPWPEGPGKAEKWFGTITDIEARKSSELLAHGQLETLTQTLSALSRESEPEKFLELVLTTICRQSNSDNAGVWRINDATGCVELIGNCENGVLRLSTVQEIRSSPQVIGADEEHPVWTEFFRSGRHCVWGEVDVEPARVRNLTGAEPRWHPWVNENYAKSNVPALLRRLAAGGVLANLSIPMFIAGEVRGFISIRFREKREFGSGELELLRALAHQAMLALQLERLSRNSRETAVSQERLRMAREVHDTLAQGSTGVILQLEAAEEALRQGRSEKVVDCLLRAKGATRESLWETRRLVQALRPQAIADVGLVLALETLMRKMTEGVAVEGRYHSVGESQVLPPDWEDNLLRISQEALTNALRYSRAKSVTMKLVFADSAVELSIVDDGCGFDINRSSEGFGILGMRERTEKMGGRLKLKVRRKMALRSQSTFPPPGF